MQFLSQNLFWLAPLFVLDLVLKGIALWRAGRNNEPVWFVLLLVVNSLGVLPVVYLLFFQHKSASKVRR